MMADPRISGAVHQALRGHAAFRFLALLLGFGFQVFVVKILSPENYATYAVLLATLMVGERLLSFGTDRTVLRFVPALISRGDPAGLRFLLTRLGLLRATALLLFVAGLTLSPALQGITPGELSRTTTIAFGAWFVAYTLLKEADAIAQSLIMHHWAAAVAACESLMRLGSLTLLYSLSRVNQVEVVIVIYAVTSSVAAGVLLPSLWLAVRRRIRVPRALVLQNEVVSDLRHQLPRFAIAAYASTLSYLTSSPGVVRLVARTGLDIHALAAFSFVQGLSASLSSALPGQLILPSLESIAAKMTDSGRGEEIFPALSVVFKIELTCVLAIIIATAVAGAELITILSRPEYAPYYYALPVLMVGLCLQTTYRVLEILGSMNLKYRVFLILWPLSVAGLLALYITVGSLGLISVLVVPILELTSRVAISAVALRHYGIGRALDPGRSLRLILSALIVLLCAFLLLAAWGESLGGARLLVAATGVLIFLLTLVIVRPLSPLESQVLTKVLPPSWTFPRYITRRFLSS